MPLGAVGNSPHPLSRQMPVTSLTVHLVSHKFHVRRVIASPIPAEMVRLQALGYRSDQGLIGKAMGLD